MVKKILLILATVLCCVSCVEHAIRESDVFVVKSVEYNEYIKKEHNHKYKYYLYWLQKYGKYNKTLVEVVYFYSDKKYELGDTLQINLKNK